MAEITEKATEGRMKSSILVATAVVLFMSPAIASAASPCPPEVKEARELLAAKTSAAAKTAQPSKSQAGARAQDVQAPRGQEVQAPRGQDVQAPRGQEVQAPRSQEVQAPRSQEVQAPRNVAMGRANALTNAKRLVSEAEAACKDADSQRATANARAAIELLKYVP